jgi:hypothetical protein
MKHSEFITVTKFWYDSNLILISGMVISVQCVMETLKSFNLQLHLKMFKKLAKNSSKFIRLERCTLSSALKLQRCFSHHSRLPYWQPWLIGTVDLLLLLEINEGVQGHCSTKVIWGHCFELTMTCFHCCVQMT